VSRLSTVEGVVALDAALHKRLVSLGQARGWAVAHPRHRGVAKLRRAVDLAEPRAESPMETRLRLLLVFAGLPRPRVQVSLGNEVTFLGRADLYYEGPRLIIEYDGGTHRHSLASDDRRQNRLVDAGYRLLRFTAADILESPASIVALVRRSFGLDS
jgi:very-short-patch-repair endonuclease